MSALWDAADLVHATGGAMTLPFHATGVSIDSRTLAPGDLFVALKTPEGDGHDFVASALARGAAGAMVERRGDAPDEAPLLIVHDTLEGLRALATFARERFTGAVIAVTGSVGKTTTKEMLRTILAASGATHAAEASYNNHWGVPLTLARLPAGHDYAVIEIGMNHAGEIAPLARLAEPDVAVVTAVASAHIGHLGSIEAIADEKAAILDGLMLGGTAVLPADDAQLPRLLARVGGAAVRLFGTALLRGASHDADGSDVGAEIGGWNLHFRLNVPGRHMVMNALAALTAADAVGADVARGAAALAGFHAVAGRGVRRPLLGGAAVLLDESYNASAASMRASLAVLRLMPATRRIAVLGDMRELGARSEAEHAGLAPAVTDAADLLYACGPDMRVLFDAVPRVLRGAHAANSAALAPIVAGALTAGDAILVKGSFGSRMRIVVDALEARGA